MTDSADRSDAPDADGTPPYVETPYGIVTGRGRWYHATEEMLRDYAGEVFDYVSLPTLLERSDRWVDSARTVALWIVPPLLLAVSPAWAAAGALGGYVAWKVLSPSFPTPLAVRVIAGMQKVAVQAGYYVILLSVVATSGDYLALTVGLVAFVLLRWGIVDWVLTPLLRPLLQELYPLPVADQVLRGLIVRIALKHRLRLSQLDDMASDILDNWGRRPDD
jgi:hypothetical protein